MKGNTKEHIVNIYDEQNININSDEIIKIKFEVDVNPPAFATFENKYGLMPSPYLVKLYDMPFLFAGKAHAVICRAWKNRIKGRDLHDYVFYMAHQTKINLPHLRARLEDSGILNKDDIFTIDTLKKMLTERFETIDYEEDKKDVLPFIKNASSLDLWNKDFFISITDNLKDNI